MRNSLDDSDVFKIISNVELWRLSYAADRSIYAILVESI